MKFQSAHFALALIPMLPLGALAANQYDGFQYGEQYDKPLDQRVTGGGAVQGTVEERLGRIERSLSSGALIEMMGRVDHLQSETQLLRGQIEELSHTVETLREQQRKQYLDLDQRLQQGATPPAPPAPSSASSSTDAQASGSPPAASAGAGNEVLVDRQAAYQKAFATLKEGKYPEAISLFKDFAGRFPSGEYADNAQYWLGEAHYVSRQFNEARDAFQKLTEQFPESPKIPDAQLKLGFVDYEQGQWAKAREMLNAVLKGYPNSSTAKLAEKRLERMRQEGH